jgi:hypothetical protein
MSRYVRDDKKFREQIAALANAGLTLGDPTCSFYRARPCNECAVPDMQELRGETRASLQAAGFKVDDYPKAGHCPAGLPQQKPKGKLPEFAAGVVAAAITMGGGLLLLKLLGWVLALLWSVL